MCEMRAISKIEFSKEDYNYIYRQLKYKKSNYLDQEELNENFKTRLLHFIVESANDIFIANVYLEIDHNYLTINESRVICDISECIKNWIGHQPQSNIGESLSEFAYDLYPILSLGIDLVSMKEHDIEFNEAVIIYLRKWAENKYWKFISDEMISCTLLCTPLPKVIIELCFKFFDFNSFGKAIKKKVKKQKHKKEAQKQQVVN